MSRIGNAPIILPKGVELTVDAENTVMVKGPLGQLTKQINKNILIERNADTIHLKNTAGSKDKKLDAIHGLSRALIHNMVVGVTKGYSKSLIINGVGYKASATANKLVLDIGFSHSVEVKAENGIKIDASKPNQIDIIGIDKELVGRFASNIRDIKPVEPYHAYGIRYSDEVVVRKEGKTAKK